MPLNTKAVLKPVVSERPAGALYLLQVAALTPPAPAVLQFSGGTREPLQIGRLIGEAVDATSTLPLLLYRVPLPFVPVTSELRSVSVGFGAFVTVPTPFGSVGFGTATTLRPAAVGTMSSRTPTSQ